MELSAKYAYTVYKRRSFSLAARELFVSQPSLSATVARLEGELGFKIFDRGTSPLSLTPEGRIYVEYLGELIEREAEMERRIRNMSHSGSLAVGGSCYTAYGLFARIAGRLKVTGPNIKLSMDMGGEGAIGNLIEKVKRGVLDMTVGYDADDPELERIPLLEEQLGVAMRGELVPDAAAPYALCREEFISGNYSQDKRFVSDEIFRGVEFIRTGRHTSTERIARAVLPGIKFSALNIENTHHTSMHYNLMLAGVGAVLMADTHARSEIFASESLVFFVPRSAESKRTLYLIRRRDAAQNPSAEDFISAARDICASLDVQHDLTVNKTE